ncbi:hypothetical protein OA2633_00305 [Oceanicaulis sp. HTCC2633]|uniref:hypothetical protein n=1 Tax=Oceanicaulis sp. HTCC2633 TaxID=314254 RepID=UPI00006699F6|nr:hypothetical protein [Oceanicaulis sp. HTCC2633]EAP89188.1 hypothetical protein OA2633_00305 [Oceanicaulis sp. HTCC2633]
MSPVRPSWRTVEAVAPIAPPPEVCADPAPEPLPPEGAAYPEPVTPAEIRAEARLTAFLARHRAWGIEGWAVAAAARKASCADTNAS